jgi:hypothetical protein
MTLKQYTCDVQIQGKGTAKNVPFWLNSSSQMEARKAAEAQFVGQKIVGILNVKEKK